MEIPNQLKAVRVWRVTDDEVKTAVKSDVLKTLRTRERWLGVSALPCVTTSKPLMLGANLCATSR
jgi:hypothetical protein